MEEISNKIADLLSNKDEVFQRLYFVMVRENYKHGRGSVMYKPIADGLELQYKIDISDMMDGASIVVFQDFAERFSVGIKEFEDIAFNNTIALFEARFESVCDILGSIIEGLDLPLYCLTNEKKVFGAGTILYPGMKEKIESILGDFIVIPSSVHEVLVIPTTEDVEQITSIINEVNTTCVCEDEILADRPYKLISDGELMEL